MAALGVKIVLVTVWLPGAAPHCLPLRDTNVGQTAAWFREPPHTLPVLGSHEKEVETESELYVGAEGYFIQICVICLPWASSMSHVSEYGIIE